MNSSIKIWSLHSSEWNFGDVLSLVLLETLFYPFDVWNSDIRLIGSVISDGLVPTTSEPPSSGTRSRGGVAVPVIYWGSGIREPDDFCESNRDRVEFLAVRGPVSASHLRLGSTVPLGDPALLLPALYSPKKSYRFVGKSICIPHYNDKRPDDQLLETTGCDLILRPNLRPDVAAIYEFVDALCSAKFVLSASLHGAIVAAAYEVPFSYWDNEQLDIPTKWADFSELISIKAKFAKDLREGIQIYETSIHDAIKIPSLWDMIARSPFLLRENGLLKVLQHELRHIDPHNLTDEIKKRVELFQSNQSHFEYIEKQVGFFSKQRFADLSQELTREHEEKVAAERAYSALEAEIQKHEAASLRAKELADREKNELNAEIDLLRRRLDQSIATLKLQQEEFDVSNVEADKRHAILVFEKNSAEEQLKQTKAYIEKITIGLAHNREETVTLRADAEHKANLAEQRINDLLLQIVDANTNSENLQNLNAILSSERDKIDTEIAELRESMENVSRDKRSKSEQVAQLKEKVKALSTSLANLDHTLSNANQEHGILRDELSRANGELNAMRFQGLLYQDEEPSRLVERNRLKSAEDILVCLQEQRITKSNTLVSKLLAATKFAKINRHSRIGVDARLIEDFLSAFEMSAMGITIEGRRNRILKYLMGFTEYLQDFPLLRNLEYLDMNPDVRESKLNPLVHYIRHGRFEGRDIHPLLDSKFYTEKYPESKHLGGSPAEHYLRWGAAKGYSPHPLFDTQAYLSRYPDVAARGLNPLVHFLAEKRCTAHPLFDPNMYLAENPDVASSGRNPLTHYLLFGWREGRNPHPLFNTRYYLAMHSDVSQYNMNPLVHYAQFGAAEGRRTSEYFDPDFYVAAYPDIASGKQGPLVHYIEHGQREGRMAVRPFTPLPTIELATNQKPIVVMIDALFPRPDKDSGSLDQISFVKIFTSLGFEVHFIAVMEFGEANYGDNTSYISLLRDMGVRCIRSGDFAYIEEYMFIYSDRISLFFNSRVDFGGTYIDVARKLCPSAQVIFNTVDLHFVRQQREAILKADDELLRAAKEMKEREIAYARSADAVVVVSESELEILQAEAPDANPIIIPLIRDFEELLVPGPSDRSGIAFIGGFLHQPNLDAVLNFLDTTWQEIRERRPDITFYVVGSNMPEEMQTRTDPGVEFVGYVADIADTLSRVKITIAPLRYGAGAKGKLVSSLGHGVPSVVSTIAAEGMGLENGKHVIVADIGSNFASSVIELYDDDKLWQTLSQNGLDLIRRNYSIEHGVELVKQMLASTGTEIPAAKFQSAV